MRFFIAAGFALGVAGGAVIPSNIVAGIGLMVAAFFLLMTGYRADQK